MNGYGLTTKERIKDRLAITVTSFDDLLDNLILAVTDRIERMCGRRFMQATYEDELYDGSDLFGSLRNILIVKNAPVLSIASIEYKTGPNSTPGWTAFDEDDYDLDAEAGLLHFHSALPRGKRNIRISYTGGYSGFSIGINTYWTYNVVPAGLVNGVNLTFTLPEDADQIIVYADGVRLLSSNVTHTDGTDTFTLAAGQAPYSSIAVDYRQSAEAEDTENWLPADLVEVAEEMVVRIYKRRDSEGRTSEGFEASQVTWTDSIMSPEHRATIKNLRRGDSL